MKRQLVKFYSITFFLILAGCQSGSDDFSNVLDSSGGGTGTASIAITSYSPGSSSVVIKDVATKQFLVSAVGNGTLLYNWTLDGVAIGTNSPSLTLDATLYSNGNKNLRLTINDSVGTVTQDWAIKINGTPQVDSSLPAPNSVYLRRGSTMNYSVTVSDPNSDTLTYVWKLDGQESILPGTSNMTSWNPQAIDVGIHNISVDIYDGDISDAGTYKVTRTWTTYVNHFSDSCNTMENSSETNKTCVYIGISGIGDGLNPQTSPSSFYIRPGALEKTADNNIFIADDINHVVWFYNVHTSPDINVLGVTIPVNTMKVVAGVGMASSGNSASTKALHIFLNTPHGLHWDGTNLYISDASNNRVVKVDNTGTLTNVVTTGCSSPRGLTKVGTDLYIACHGSNIVRMVDVNTLVASTFAGTGAAGNPANMNESSFTDATNGRLNRPYGIASDASGNIYVGEHTGCRIRLYNQSGSAVTLYGSYTISNNNQRIIVGAAGAPSCSNVTGEPVDITGAANGRVSNVRLMHFNSSGLLLFGNDADTISALNLSASADTILGVAVPASTVKSVLGSGTAGYLGEGQLPAVTRFNNPFAVIEDTTTGDIFIADNGNIRFRKFRGSDFRTELVAGNGGQRSQTNAGQGQLEAGQEKMNSVRGLAVDSITGEVFIADSANNRIRVLNRNGQIAQAVGTGSSGTGSEENEFPTNVTMNQPRGLVLTHSTSTFGGHLVWADSQNRRIRLYNRSNAAATLFGVTVAAGNVVTIGGDGTIGNATSGSALQSAFNNPGGVAFDGTNLYVSDTSNHCIKKIDPSGNLSVTAGTCGTAGNINGAAGAGRLNNPEGIDYYVNGTHSGLLIADRANNRVRFSRFAGSSLLFGGSISIGDTNTIACGGTFHTEGINAGLAICSGVYDVTISGTDVCFINYTYHNSRCVKATGEIYTLMGSVEGIDDSQLLFAPGTSLSSEDFNLISPNYSSQNGIAAFYLPSPIAAPLLTDSFGQLTFPMSIKSLDANTLIIAEYNLGLIRKVKKP